MSSDSPSVDAMTVYGAGQAAFERGNYREATDLLQKALTLTSANSALGGAIQIWLVTAYDALDKRDEALSLCRKLKTHGDYDTRQQAKRLIYILEAPKLQSRPEWLTQIPDLSQPTANVNALAGRSGKGTAKKEPEPKGVVPFDPIDPKDSRGFLGLALGVSGVVLLLLWWFAQGS
jgi:tetratricopeptide (TPR) repeat protein